MAKGGVSQNPLSSEKLAKPLCSAKADPPSTRKARRQNFYCFFRDFSEKNLGFFENFGDFSTFLENFRLI